MSEDDLKIRNDDVTNETIMTLYFANEPETRLHLRQLHYLDCKKSRVAASVQVVYDESDEAQQKLIDNMVLDYIGLSHKKTEGQIKIPIDSYHTKIKKTHPGQSGKILRVKFKTDAVNLYTEEEVEEF